MAGDELELIEWLRRRQGSHPRVSVGIGDDMAVLRSHADRMLVSSDLLLDGVHFDSTRHTRFQIGRKAVARTMSDCAAMAVCPMAITFSVAIPTSLDLNAVHELFDGVFAGAAEFDVPLVGGDTARWDHPLAMDVNVIAEPFTRIEPKTRCGARVGDQILVTGELGGSLLGRHLQFTPRIVEARLLAERLGSDLHAMIDVSDGLSLDLWRICEASGVGAVLVEQRLLDVVSDDANRMAALDLRTPLDHVLGDGEDYELLVAVAPQAETTGLPLRLIGHVVERGLALLRINGSVEALTPRGFVH